MDHAQLSGWICLKNRPLSVNICGGESTDVLLMKRSIHTVHNPLKTGDNQTVTFQLTLCTDIIKPINPLGNAIYRGFRIEPVSYITSRMVSKKHIFKIY